MHTARCRAGGRQCWTATESDAYAAAQAVQSVRRPISTTPGRFIHPPVSQSSQPTHDVVSTLHEPLPSPRPIVFAVLPAEPQARHRYQPGTYLTRTHPLAAVQPAQARTTRTTLGSPANLANLFATQKCLPLGVTPSTASQSLLTVEVVIKLPHRRPTSRLPLSPTLTTQPKSTTSWSLAPTKSVHHP